MDKEMLEQFQMIMQGMSAMEERINQRMDGIEQRIDGMEGRLNKRIDGLELYIENTVTKKIEVLFDGYKLTHEKQWEMERKIEELERRIERLENVG